MPLREFLFLALQFFCVFNCLRSDQYIHSIRKGAPVDNFDFQVTENLNNNYFNNSRLLTKDGII